MPYTPEKLKAWKLANKERLLAYNRDYSKRRYKEDPDTYKKRSAEYRRKNPDKVKSYLSRPEVVAHRAALSKSHYQKNKRRLDAALKKWKQEHPARMKYYSRKSYCTHKAYNIDRARARREQNTRMCNFMRFLRVSNGINLCKGKKKPRKLPR